MQVGRTVHPNHAGIYLGKDPALPQQMRNKDMGQGGVINKAIKGR